jgi:flagellar hook protein FlgE
MLYQTQQAASGLTSTNGGVNPQQVGIGVKIGSTDSDLSQGGVQTTGVATNMMINGDGYFILADTNASASTPSTPKTNGSGSPTYTRNGDFSLNADGLLYDPSSGLGVMGYTANAAGVISPTGDPGPIQIPIGLKSVATATGSGTKLGPTGDQVFDLGVSGNLDATQFSAAVSNGAVNPSNLMTVGATIYDSLGGPHEVNVTFQPTLSNAGLAPLPFEVNNAQGTAVTAATEWAYTLSSSDGTQFSGGSTTSPVQYAFFDQYGQFINTSSTAAPAVGAVLGGANVHAAGAAPSTAAGDQLSVTQWGPVVGSNNSATFAAAPLPGPIGLDLSSVTALSSTATLVSTQNGVAPGVLSNISVGQDGTITGSFTNGLNETLARVAVATFQNEEGLSRLGGSQFAATAASGQALIGTPNAGRFGAIQSDSLEMSNVSIADEFTKLITAQNAFTANSKSITTANENLQTVIGLIH